MNALHTEPALKEQDNDAREIPNSEADLKPAIPAAESALTPGGKRKPGDYVLGFIVIALGIMLGAIAAEVIALLTGWIQINC